MVLIENATIVRRDEPPLPTYEEVLHDIRRYQIALRFTTRKLEGTEDASLKEVYGISKDALEHSIAKYGDLTAVQPDPALTSEKQVTL